MLNIRRVIPRRTAYALSRTVNTSPWATSWQRLYRQVFWLSDGCRDIARIATLLHKSEARIEEVLTELAVSGYISLEAERKVLVMNAALLKESFEMVAPQKDDFARRFYERLFSYYPETRSLFAQTDMRRQESVLMATLAAVVAGVERGENLTPILQKLGEKHYGYGVQPEHYPLVGGVLLETFDEFLGSQFTSEMQDAWSQAFEIISTQMIAAGRP
jgi:hemoglobin-like flavoprotein